MTYSLKPKMLNAIIHSPFHGLTYIANQKAGSTSIKYTLWKDFDLKTGQKTLKWKTHDIDKSPFLKRPIDLYAHGLNNLQNSQFFTVVRNPYVRILSGYLHKIETDSINNFARRCYFYLSNKTDAWKLLCEWANINPFTKLTFLDFLKILDRLEHYQIPSHFRPQYINTLVQHVPYDFVGYLEYPQDIANFLKAYDIAYIARVPHARNAKAKLDKYYGPDEIALVQKIFKLDFDYFGYDDDISNATEKGTFTKHDATLEPIINLIDRIGQRKTRQKT